uniref:Adrenomedullin n=1 Tax=Eptatretus burgeri TaxID=7764 RepID=C8XQL1_EPTBU|nr:adrenomedullin [Eptatretus burgeri]
MMKHLDVLPWACLLLTVACRLASTSPTRQHIEEIMRTAVLSDTGLRHVLQADVRQDGFGTKSSVEQDISLLLRSLLAHPREKRFPKLHHTRTTRAGCSLGTCQVQNLTHRLFRLVGKTGKDDAAGKATWNPNSYGRKRRSLELKQRGAIERGFRTGSWLVRGSDGKITRMSS